MFEKSVNDFSFWFPKVKDCGIKAPKTYIMQLNNDPDDPLQRAFFMEKPEEDLEYIRQWVKTQLIPELEKERLLGRIFVKNARFSNKFQAKRNCIHCGTSYLAEGIAEINYAALMLGAYGTHEIVVRDFIDYDSKTTACIYEGLPLRPEFRVFYDFDSGSPIFTANYWDYDYCYPRLWEATDKIIFEHEREKIESAFEKNKDHVQRMVADAMKNVDGLNGQWSIDILMDEVGEFWLIDMAVAQQSAYWEQRPDGN